jgi:ADP-ribose pyrophosphatase YjhB (NUDIX family)
MPLITVDGLLLKISRTGEFEGIILEKRAKTVQREPNKWVFPAGFVKAHERTSETLAYEVFEETGIRLKEEQILSVYKIDTNPQRDPKWFVWTEFLIAFTTEDLPELPSSAVDEVEDVKVFPLSNLPPESLIGFDHAKVITEFIHFIPYYVTKARQVIEREAR